MAIITEGADAAPDASLRPVTLGWALKRALLGIAILVLAMGSVAWLTYASIDPDLERGDEPSAAKASQAPMAQVRL
jgi:hypothetical protein